MIPKIIKVCVGSSCHLKGSYDVLEAFKAVLKKYQVDDKVDLQASFCLGHCAHGVSVSGEEFLLHGVNAANAEELFTTDIYPKLFKE